MDIRDYNRAFTGRSETPKGGNLTQSDEHPDDTPEHPEEVWAKKEFGLLLHRLQQLPTRSRGRLQSDFTQKLLGETLTVETPVGPLSFVLLGKTAAGRALSLLTKQPATIRWVDSFQPNSVFWDVGANVGVYTLYAARRGDVKVVAFEPAAVNYFLLAANCEANKLDSQVDCLPVGLGSDRAIARFDVSQFESAKSFSVGGKRADRHHSQQATLVLSMDRLIDEYGLACPNYIKIDAPGALEAIIACGTRTLQRRELRELHIEIREQSKAAQRILAVLERSGFAVAGRDGHGGSADLTFARSV